jgi:hypothetical protein
MSLRLYYPLVRSFIAKAIFFCILSLSLFSTAQAQSKLSDEAFLEKLALYSQSDPTGLLFVHTDKTLYTNNEDLWFSAYLLNSGAVSSESHQILSLALIRESDRIVYLQDKYMMEEGLAFGSLALPDSIPPGNYQLIASTNVLGPDSLPLVVFTQAITIKSITQQDFTAALSLIDTVVTDGAVRAKLMVTVNDPDPKLKPSLAYSVGSYQQKSMPLKSVLHTITIPEEQLNQDRPVLLTEITYNKQTQFLSVKLPKMKPKGIAIRFFPEGGYLVEEQESLVGWEATTADGRPLSVSGILYEDGNPIDTLSGNSYGMGAFNLRPKKNKEYTFRINKNEFLDQDPLYKLPAAVNNGVVLRLKDAVVNDTLKMELYSQTPREVQVLLHNYREGYASFSVQAKTQGGSATIALQSLPKGIATVTVLDEEGKPLAERLFFAHYDRGIKAIFHLDKASYGKKKKARVKLKVTDPKGKPAKGIVSIAAVQKNRLEVEKRKDIETYVFMERALGDLPTDPQGQGYGNKEYLEDMLLIKGWRKYTWQGLMSVSEEGAQTQSYSPKIKGQVLRNDKPLRKSTEVTVMRDSLFNLVTTDSLGGFILKQDDLLSEPDKKILLSVNEKNKAAYTIQVEDPYVVINQKLAENTVFPLQGNHDVQSSSDLQMSGLENALALNTVTVTGRRDGFLYGTGPRGANECGDYVCIANILNCRNHRNDHRNHPPIKGAVYYNATVTDLGVNQLVNMVYDGCTTNSPVLFKVSGIYLDRDFYGVSIEKEDLSEPQYLSTLFWQPGIMLNEKGEAEFSFLTGDITGDFTIVVQGVGEGDLIFGTGKLIVN